MEHKESIHFRFKKVRHFCSTRTSEAYFVQETNAERNFILWVLRYPLGVSTQASTDFINRIEFIKSSFDTIVPIIEYGIDESGVAYLLQEYIPGKFIFDLEIDYSRKLSIFHQILSIVADFHDKNVVLGDICNNSFIVKDDGLVFLNAYLGSFDGAAKGTALLPPAHTLPFVSPEQGSGWAADSKTDVFAIGILAKEMFSNLPLKNFNKFISKSLDVNPQERYFSASEMFEDFEKIEFTEEREVQEINLEKSLVNTSKSETLLKRNYIKKSEIEDVSPVDNASNQDLSRTKESSNKHSLKPVLLILILVSLLILVFFLLSGSLFKSKVLQFSQESICSSGNTFSVVDVSALKEEYCKSSPSFHQKEGVLQKLSSIKAFDAQKFLIQASYQEDVYELREKSVEYLVNWYELYGYRNLGLAYQSFFKTYEGLGRRVNTSPAFIYIQNVVDLSLPFMARRDALIAMTSKEKSIAHRLAAALAIGSESKDFDPVFREIIQKDFPTKDLSSLDTITIILSDDDLGEDLQIDTEKIVKNLSSEDLKWLLERLALYNKSSLFELVSELLRQGKIQGYNAVFAQNLLNLDKFGSSAGIKKALVNGMFSSLLQADINQFGRWLSIESEKILLASIAVSSDPQVIQDAFDTLCARTLTSEPSSILIPWVKSTYWDRRVELAKPLAILALQEYASDLEINETFDKLTPIAPHGPLIDTMIKINKAELILKLLDRVGAVMPEQTLLDLLKNKDANVRVRAVELLEGKNNINTLKAIFSAYEAEKDPQIKKRYKEVHWVVRNREKNR